LRYSGVVRKIIKAIKYRGSYDMVAELVGIWNLQRLDGEWIITAVPMWEPKRKLRGFNQAELIARMVAKRWGMEYRELLTRTRETMPMYGLKREERIENVGGAFEVNHKSQTRLAARQVLQFSNVQRIVLVDDVWTSGATMSECVRVLYQAGAGRVVMVSVAR